MLKSPHLLYRNEISPNGYKDQDSISLLICLKHDPLGSARAVCFVVVLSELCRSFE